MRTCSYFDSRTWNYTFINEWGKFYPKKLSKKSYPQISDVKNFIEKFYPKFVLSQMYTTYSTSLYMLRNRELQFSLIK